jgi:NADPH:quinone reductase-like Zn-dependent oxidoreductase
MNSYALGADEMIDYQTEDFSARANEFDVVFDTVGGDYGERSLRVIRPGGLLVTIVDRTNAELAQMAEAAGVTFVGTAVEPDYAGLERLTERVEDGGLRVHVEHVLPLASAAKAHEIGAAGGAPGKIVLDVT